jgi:hypothetical protein
MADWNMASTMIQIYSDPARLLDRAATDRSIWRRAWLLNAAVLLLTLVILGAAASLSGKPWTMMLGYAVLVIVPYMLGISIAVTTTGHARLWLLYLGAPLTMLTALLSGLGVLWPGGWALSGAVGVPVLLGVLLACACRIWVYNRVVSLAREKTRQRQAGPPADLPVLTFQNRTRVLRFVASAGLGLLALAAQLLFWAANLLDGLLTGLALLVCAGACLRIEASLLCWLGKPLVALDQQGTWHATYVGRWALFTPTTSILVLLTNPQPAAQASAALIALFQEGAFGPGIRRACAYLTVAQAEHLTLSLSLQPGGGGALRYLAPAMPAQVRDIAMTYARLAEETAQPRDMQRWLAALTDHPGITQLSGAGLAPDLAQALLAAGGALQCYAYDPVLEEAADHLRRVLPKLSDDTSSPVLADDRPGRWPEALLERVLAQGRLLGAHQLTGFDSAKRSRDRYHQ